MNSSLDDAPAMPFFLKAEPGERFCLYYPPPPGWECRGALIYVHPFGEEMNKSRRMAAMQARAFAAVGFGVLQIDLFGCGDSDGEFGDARWNIWKRDLVTAWSWLEDRVAAPISLWGLRLGALLALDFARSSENPIHKIILWQPVISGESFLTRFLRLRLANEILLADAGVEKNTGTNAMRNSLRAGNSLEVAGYELSPEMAAAIDILRAAELFVTRCPVHWFEIVAEPGRSMAAAGAKAITAWKQNGVDLRLHLVPCLSFWATQEISECPELVLATADIFSEQVR
ncbi:exosortase A system-associated hydrolase 2 [Nitrosospira sp. Nsp11]|uniref:hydrolase 2, exosortase A system-associated n=1 Tax=unclassified Nitrosospira TaxID=2609267 RepID=UPI00088AD918|nr:MULTISPECIES: hydrolase 2, exosortase A system-associated [unclassified Nitrosospira]SDA25488.1 exosortase A system-associated hydrolase 2 [Nitrosospira sp. Nsp18]SHL99604.1 exosortase A system-associated hydrolase 2 [Nitrosospira sp. Nsp11]